MTAPAYPYQQEGSDYLAQRRTAYLGDDPGLGKTRQVIDAADKINADRILVICPASLKVNWLREFAKFSQRQRPTCIPKANEFVPDSGPLVCVINYEIAIRPGLHWLLSEMQWDVLVCDESHKLKSTTAKATRAVLGEKGLYQHAAHVWLMSGTPAPNHAGELYPALHALYPDATHGLAYDQWLRRYCHVIPGTYSDKVTGHKPEIAQLKQALGDFMIRRKRSEVLKDLPPLRIGRMTVENEDALKAIEQAQRDDPLLAGLVGADVEEALENELDEMQLSTLRRLCGEAKAHALVPVIKDELDSGTEQIVLMCWHRNTMDVLHDGLTGYGVARIDGATKNRQAEVDRFQSHAHTSQDATRCRVFIGQIQAAGTGHTLTAAQDMMIVEPSWVPGDNLQAMLRIHRIGQTGSCFIRFTALAGSLDEAIINVAERKANLLAELL